MTNAKQTKEGEMGNNSFIFFMLKNTNYTAYFTADNNKCDKM